MGVQGAEEVSTFHASCTVTIMHCVITSPALRGPHMWQQCIMHHIMHHASCITHHAPCHASCIMHHVMRHASCIMHHIIHHAPYHTSCIMHHITHHASCTISCTMYHASCTTHHAPYHSSVITHHAPPRITHLSSRTMHHHASLICHHASCTTTHHASCTTTHHAPYHASRNMHRIMHQRQARQGLGPHLPSRQHHRVGVAGIGLPLGSHVGRAMGGRGQTLLVHSDIVPSAGEVQGCQDANGSGTHH